MNRNKPAKIQAAIYIFNIMEGIMKKRPKKESVKTTPNGVWESSHTDSKSDNTAKSSSQTTDLQGNGYPQNKSGK